MITAYLRERASLCLVVALFDIRRSIREDDRGLLTMLDDFGRPVVAVATKIDKLPKAKRKLAIASLEEATRFPVYPSSAKSGEGTEDLWRVITRACGIV